MNLTGILEGAQKRELQSNWFPLLIVEQTILEQNFSWLKTSIKRGCLFATGMLIVNGEQFDVEIEFSPFFKYRFDRIRIRNHGIKFNDEIHVYHDLTLCLYHPYYDLPYSGYMPLYKIIPWISEWCHFYGQWKKYRVWLGDEIKHGDLRG